MDEKKRILSGIQSSGLLTLGNYIGALRNWGTLQDDYDCFYCVADLHSITVRQDPAQFRKRAMEIFTIYLASGIDPEKSTLFFQSHVSAHAELNWILNCYTYMGELQRMTQFKDKSAKHADNINSGLFTYPVLMSADILLYQADLVPVGHDQLQHLELTRDIANRFNNIYGDVFTMPEPYIGKVGARIMSLAEPTSKMSKSDPNPNGYIAILDDRDTIIRKFKKAVTDSDGEIAYKEGKDGINNLLSIYSAITNKTIDEAVLEFQGKGYGEFKLAVAETVADTLAPLQDRFNKLSQDKAYLKSVYEKGAEKAAYTAYKTLRKVYKKVGFTER
ncbi:MAG: tryptophan--tRNA ligase [Clostridia bacterium]|nr:tryptophan--tRNA ligase [Clostridia bacterium]MBQ9997686.1 tryptophan--tRNA ligase [Clostridia bacterium]